MAAITYPLSLPSAFKSSDITISPIDVVGVSAAPQSLVEQTYEFPGKRWEATITLRPNKRRQAEQILGTILALNGASGTFYCGDTANRLPAGVATGTPLTNGIQTRFGNTLLTKGWTAGVTGILLAGDWIQIGTGSTRRLHKVCFDVNSDGSGNADLTVWPRLRDATADGVTLVVNNPTGVFFLAANMPWKISTEKIYGMTLQAVESLF